MLSSVLAVVPLLPLTQDRSSSLHFFGSYSYGACPTSVPPYPQPCFLNHAALSAGTKGKFTCDVAAVSLPTHVAMPVRC